MVECAGRRILIDCGLLQGSRELDEENADPFGFDPAAIDCVLLTHAHLDHCGRLPLLVRRGFRGEVIATAATHELTRLVLLDAAHLQDEEARRHSRHARRHGIREARPPLFTLLDALDTMDRFGRAASYGVAIDVFPQVRASFHDAGHILGSASILLDIQEQDRHRRILYSGDLGSAGRPLLRVPVPPGEADVVVMETTYGDRLHRPYGELADELRTAINQTFERGGNVVIPTFALERAQEILFVLRKDVNEGHLPRSLQVYLDSPMADLRDGDIRAPSRLLQPGRGAVVRGGPRSVPPARPAVRARRGRVDGDQSAGRRGSYPCRIRHVYRRAGASSSAAQFVAARVRASSSLATPRRERWPGGSSTVPKW